MVKHIETLGEWKIYKDSVTEQDIRERAYFKWLEAGCPDRRDQELWLSAERELLYPTFPNLGPPVMGDGFFYYPCVPKEFNSPVVEGLDSAKTKEVSTYSPENRRSENPVASRANALLRFGKKLLSQVKGKNANTQTNQ